jgi:hypothetical protein
MMTCKSIPIVLFVLWFATICYAAVGWVIHPDENTVTLDWHSPQHPDIQLVQENYQVTIVKPDLSAKATEIMVFHNYGEAQQVEMVLNYGVSAGLSIDNLEVYVDGQPSAVTRWYAELFLDNTALQDKSSAEIAEMLSSEEQVVYGLCDDELVCHKLTPYEPPADQEEFCPEETGDYLADIWKLEIPANGQVTVKFCYDFYMRPYYSNVTVLPIFASPGWRSSIEKWKAEIDFEGDAEVGDILYLSGTDVFFQSAKSGKNLIFTGEDMVSSWSDVNSAWYGGISGVTLYGQYDPLYSHPLVQIPKDSPVYFLYDLNENYPQGFKPPQLTQSSYVEVLDVQRDWFKVKLLGVGAEWDQIRNIGWIEWRGFLDCSSVPALQVIDAEPQSFYLDEKCSQLCPDKSQIYTGEWIYVLGRVSIDTCQVLVGGGEQAPGWNKLSSAKELYLGYIRFWEGDKDDKIKMNFVLE